MKLDLTDGSVVEHCESQARPALHDDIGRSKYPSFSSANARVSANWGNDYLKDKLHEHSSSEAGGKPRHRLQMKLRSTVLFYSSGYGPPPARPTVLETDTSALPIQSLLPMSRIPSGDQPQLPLMRSS
jgi:hypothetical protein